MSLIDVLEQKKRKGERTFSVEISPPMKYPDLVKTGEMVEALKDLDLDGIALTNNTGGSFKLNPLAVVETVRTVLRTIPIILHITSRDEGSVRTVYTHLDDMVVKNVSDVLIIRGDPSPTNSRQTDAYKFSTVDLVKLMSDYSRERAYSMNLFVSGHPEFPPHTWQKHMQYQQKKIEAGAVGIIANIVTDPDAYNRYVETARACGIDVPIIPSVIPLTSLPRCEFLEKQLHIPVPETVKAKLQGLSKEEAIKVGIDISGQIAEEVLRQGAPGVNFNVIFPRDVESVKELLRCVRGYATIWEKYQIEDPAEIDYYECLKDGYF
jgi:methylenetetrahydrofolate reductase (NADPH)